MSFVSYAQNFEDVVLWRALSHIKNGFYIDVGAHDPDIDSVTNAFYQEGWRGINIEPLQNYYEKLCLDRPEDTNLNFAISDTTGTSLYFAIDGLSTLKTDIALYHKAQGKQATEFNVQTKTLNEVCKAYSKGPIHFLKIDVEGAEKEVLNGIDLSKYRPWVIVIEAVFPLTKTENYKGWESILLDHAYDFVFFDGLNRFYLANEHAELIQNLNLPANIFDNFIRRQELFLQESYETLNIQHNHFMRDQIAENARLANELNNLQAQYQLSHQNLEQVLNSRSWLLTKPFRKMGSIVKSLKNHFTIESK